MKSSWLVAKDFAAFDARPCGGLEPGSQGLGQPGELRGRTQPAPKFAGLWVAIAVLASLMILLPQSALARSVGGRPGSGGIGGGAFGSVGGRSGSGSIGDGAAGFGHLRAAIPPAGGIAIFSGRRGVWMHGTHDGNSWSGWTRRPGWGRSVAPVVAPAAWGYYDTPSADECSFLTHHGWINTCMLPGE
jgi:hypothetical protein